MNRVIKNTNWMIDGECTTNLDYADLFIPPPGKETSQSIAARTEEAKKLCGKCAVQEVCREYGLQDHKEKGSIDGVWGGLTEKERDEILYGADETIAS